MNVQVIRMMSSEEVIAEVISHADGKLVISNPVVLVPQGNGNMGFAPWAPFVADDVKELTIPESYTVYTAEAKKEVVENYEQLFSTIITPKGAGKIIT